MRLSLKCYIIYDIKYDTFSWLDDVCSLRYHNWKKKIKKKNPEP